MPLIVKPGYSKVSLRCEEPGNSFRATLVEDCLSKNCFPGTSISLMFKINLYLSKYFFYKYLNIYYLIIFLQSDILHDIFLISSV